MPSKLTSMEFHWPELL